MIEFGLLSALADQATREGASVVTVHALVEEAADYGAARALARLGLEGAVAAQDMREVRDLLDSWRDAKRSFTHSFIGWICRLAVIGVFCLMMIKWRMLPDILLH